MLNPNDIDVWAIQDGSNSFTFSHTYKTVTSKVLNKHNFSWWCIVWKLENGRWVKKEHVDPSSFRCTVCGHIPGGYYRSYYYGGVYDALGNKPTPNALFKQALKGTQFYCKDHKP